MAERIEVAELPDALDGQRVDRVVSLIAGISRSAASALVAAGRVTLDGAPVARPSVRVAVGSRLGVELAPAPEQVSARPGIAFQLRHVDAAVVVVDKPAGLVVHPGAGTSADTLVHGLLARFPEIASVGPADRPGIVHRLDKGTSGLLMVARTEVALASLSAQLRARTVTREYRTLVWGAMEAERGTIDAPLGRSAAGRRRQAVVAEGRPARTGYEVVERLVVPPGALPAGRGGGGGGGQVVSLLRCRLETGRTHQIRAHLEAIGHPVVGDPSYRGSGGRSGLGLAPGRPFLHAAVLGFDHPTSGERLELSSPLPDDLRSLLVTLGSAAG